MLICSLFTTQLNLFILGQISAARSERWYRKLEFCFNSWWLYYHRLSWNSSHVMLALFLLYSFLVWIFSWRDLFQVTGSDTSFVFCIICSQFITIQQVSKPIASGLLYCWHHLIPLCFALALIYFWLNLVVQFTSEFSLSCANLCKVSTDDSDHVMS